MIPWQHPNIDKKKLQMTHTEKRQARTKDKSTVSAGCEGLLLQHFLISVIIILT